MMGYAPDQRRHTENSKHYDFNTRAPRVCASLYQFAVFFFVIVSSLELEKKIHRKRTERILFCFWLMRHARGNSARRRQCQSDKALGIVDVDIATCHFLLALLFKRFFLPETLPLR